MVAAIERRLVFTFSRQLDMKTDRVSIAKNKGIFYICAEATRRDVRKHFYNVIAFLDCLQFYDFISVLTVSQL